jgi:hypothetical protein
VGIFGTAPPTADETPDPEPDLGDLEAASTQMATTHVILLDVVLANRPDGFAAL